MNSTQTKYDYFYLEEAYTIARLAQGNTFPNPIVGAILTKQNKKIASAYHHTAGGAHAESAAIDQTDESAGSTLYTTLEPCAYSGADKLTAPCVDKIIAAKIARVVIGAIDPNQREQGRSIAILKKNNIAVTHLDMQAQFTCQNEGYVSAMRNNRPLIELKLAQTVDGYSADDQNGSQWISDTGALRYAHLLRARHNAILIGTNTALRDNPRLSVRHGVTRFPTRIVLDRTLRLPLTLRLFQKDRQQKTVVVYARPFANEKKIAKLHAHNIQTMAVSATDRIDLSELCAVLQRERIGNSMLVEGGATLVSAFLEQNLWDKITTIIAPRLLGGGLHIHRKNAQTLQQSVPLDKSIWYHLDHFQSRCMVFRGYRNCSESFGIPGKAYQGEWNV